MPTLSASQFLDWKIYNRLEPFGVDATHRILCNMLATYLNGHRGDNPPVDPEDLLQRIDTVELWDEIEAQMKEHERLARMTQEQRNAEAVAQFMAAHAARQGRKVDDTSGTTDELEEG